MNPEVQKVIKEFLQGDLPSCCTDILSVDAQSNYYLSNTNNRILRFNRNPYERCTIFEIKCPRKIQTIKSIKVNSSGLYILLSGFYDTCNGFLLLMDTANVRPVTTQSSQQQIQNIGFTQTVICVVKEVDPTIFSFTLVRQVEWHPYSMSHFAVLMANNDFRLYNVQCLQRAEQSVTLRFGSGRQLGLWGCETENDVLRFEFANNNGHAWSLFTVYFLKADGGVYAMCPIAPFRIKIKESVARDLLNSAEPSSGAREWVKHSLLPTKVFQIDYNQNSIVQEVPVQARPFLNHVPMLQGPLNDVKATMKELLEDLDDDPYRVFSQLIQTGYQNDQGYVISLGIVGKSGKIGFLWQSDEVMPLWQHGEPTIMKNQAGRVIQIQWVSQATISDETSLHLLDVVDPSIEVDHSEEGMYTEIKLKAMKLVSENVVVCAVKNIVMTIQLPWCKQLAKAIGIGKDSNLDTLDAPRISKIEMFEQDQPMSYECTIVGFATSNFNLYSLEMLTLLRDKRFSLAVQDMEELCFGREEQEWALSEYQFSAMTAKPSITLCPPSFSSADSSIRVPKSASMATVKGCMEDGIERLKETFTSFLRQAHCDMKKHMQELREQPNLAPEVLKIEELYQQVLKRNEGIESRIVRAKNIQNNLQERFMLMKEVSLLNTSLSDKLSWSEIDFKKELADMQRQLRVLAEKSMRLRKLFTESWQRDADGGIGMSYQPESVSEVHMGKLKQMLEAHNKSIADIKKQVKILERSVNEETARLN